MSTPSRNPIDIIKKINLPSGGTLIMIVVVCVLGGIGLFTISKQEEYLVQRNFRLLQLWSQDISSKIESYHQVFRFSAKGIFEELHNKIYFEKKSDQPNRNRFVTTYNLSKSPSAENDFDHATILKKVSPWSCATQSMVTTRSEIAQDNQDKKSRPKDQENTNDDDEIIQNLERQLAAMCLDEGLTTITLSISGKNSTEAKTEAETTANTKIFELSINHKQTPPTIQLTYSQSFESNEENPLSRTTETIKMIGEIDLHSFLTRLFKEPIFDQVLLFDSVSSSTSSVEKDFPLLFDSGSQEFSWANFQTLIEQSVPSESYWEKIRQKPQDESIFHEQLRNHNSPNQFLINSPGKTSNVFTLPLIVSGNENTAWRLVGMIDHNVFENSYLAISSSFVQWIIFLILGLLISVPFLHLKTMGPKDPLRMSHVLTIILAAFLGTGAFTFFVLDLAIYDESTFTMQERMETSAQNMKEHVHKELRNVLSTLTGFDESAFLRVDRNEIINADKNTVKKLEKVDSKESKITTSGKMSNDSEKTSLVGERSVLLEVFEREHSHTLPNRQCNALDKGQTCYPDFLSAFWMDQDGSLRINWAQTSSRGVSTNVSLHNRDYVKKVLNAPDRLWEISRESGKDETKLNQFRFFLEPIISWKTGENTVVASMRSKLMLEENTKPWVAAMEFKFISLMDEVVLPPGIGFAVITNDTHQVLFHSKEGRNLREAFLVETDQNQQLRDLLSSRTAGHVNGSYWGKTRSFYSLPLDPLPWTLVVYRDREILQSVNLFGLMIAGVIYCLWSLAVYLILWILLRRITKHRKAVCLWPKIADHSHYVTLLKSNVVMFIIGIISLWMWSGKSGWQLLIALLIIPSSSLFIAFFLIKWEWSKTFIQKCDTSIKMWIKNLNLTNTKSVCTVQTYYKRARTWITKTFDVSLTQFIYRNSYPCLGTSCLLVFAVIPAFACFTSVFHKEMTLLTQYQLLETFKSLENSGRQQSLSPISNTLTLKKIPFKENCHHSSSTDSESYYGFYPNFFLSTQWSNCTKGKSSGESHYSMFDQFFAFVSQPFLPLLKKVSLWGFIEEPSLENKEAPSNQRPFYWDINSGNTEKEKFSVLLTDNHIKVISPLPLQPWFLGYSRDLRPITPGKTIKYGFIAGLFFVWIILIPRFIATRTVFLNYPTPFKVPQNLLFDPSMEGHSKFNQLILGFPGQGKSPKASHHHNIMKQQYEAEKKKYREDKNETIEPDGKQEEKPSPFPHYFDMRAFPPEKWKEKLTKDISDLHHKGHHNLHVFIDHLERQWKDPATNLKKLELLEWLFNPTYQKRKIRMEVRTEQTSSK